MSLVVIYYEDSSDLGSWREELEKTQRADETFKEQEAGIVKEDWTIPQWQHALN